MKITPEQYSAFEVCRAIRTASGEFCFSWIAQEYKDRGLTQQHLAALAHRGFLIRVDESRRGSRVYYRVNPDWPSTPERMIA